MSHKGTTWLRLWLAAILFISVRLSAADADGNVVTAAILASWCEPYRTSDSSAEPCWSYVEVMRAFAANAPPEATGHSMVKCLPPTITTPELIRVFLRYMDTHPQVGTEPAGRVQLMAYQAAYPCSTVP